MNTVTDAFTPGHENDYQCFIGVGIGIGIGVEEVPGSSLDTDPDSDPDPDGKPAGRMICRMYFDGKGTPDLTIHRMKVNLTRYGNTVNERGF